MSCTLEEWWRTDYAEDILKNFRSREEQLPEYMSQSPQLYMRRYLVDWISLIAEKRNICNTALHLAVYLLDHFMDNHDIDAPRLHLAALGSLSLACKFEERDNKVPRLGELNKLVCNGYSLKDFIQIEGMLLKYFNWELYVPTTAHFAECFSDAAVSESDLLMGHPISLYSQVYEHVQQYIKYFLDLSLQDDSFLRFRPSLVAAACIASTRICLNITPDWPLFLHNKTLYAFEKLMPCVDIMMRSYQSNQMSARCSTKRKNEDDSDYSKRIESLIPCRSSPASPTSCSR